MHVSGVAQGEQHAGDSDGDAFLTASKSDVVAFDMYPISPSVTEGDEKPLRDFAAYAERFDMWERKYVIVVNFDTMKGRDVEIAGGALRLAPGGGALHRIK